MNKPLTATEIKKAWERVHEVGCNCERCYVNKRIEVIQKAIFTPLIKRVKAFLKERGKL